ncbi:MAG: outer membrane lipoprotein-sorting protein, partial [Bacillota bacterium]|nr:outer membrane lipoprotein-sorting protein [Bacillota bacterium]
MRRWAIVVLTGLVLSLGAVPSVPARELTAEEIIDRVEEAARAESQIMLQRMSIINKAGQVRTRELKIWSAGTKKTLIRVLGPADVKGTGFLTVDRDMWLYLPAVGKVRRIASHMKKGSFLGSDFSYEDIGVASYKEDYKPKLLGTENVGGQAAYVLELSPVGADVTYGKLKLWAEKETFVLRRVEFYDRRGALLKVLTTSDVERVGRHYVARKLVMENVAEQHRTV